MADPRSSDGVDAALKKQLRDTMDQILEICDRNIDRSITDAAFPPSVPGGKRLRTIVLKEDRPVKTTHLRDLGQLYREESKIRKDFQDLMNSRICNPNTPQPTPNLPGNAAQRMIQQGPRLTTADYALLAKATDQQLIQDADRIATRNNWIANATTQLSMNVPSHSTETLEDFFEECGVPNSAEVYMLTEALNISAEAVNIFFKTKSAMSEDMRAADAMLQMKSMLRKVQKRGGLQEMQQKARDHEIAVDDMD